MIRRLVIVLALTLCAGSGWASTFFRCANGNWNAVNTWSLVSTTTACTSATAPTASDDCIFDSGTPNGTTTINVAATCNKIYMDGTLGNASAWAGTLAGSSALAVSDAVILSGSATYTCTSTVTYNTTTTVNYKSNGKNLCQNQVFSGAAGKWTFTDAYKYPGTCTLTQGDIDFNTNAVAVTGTGTASGAACGSFSVTSNSLTRSVEINNTWELDCNTSNTNTDVWSGNPGTSTGYTMTWGTSSKLLIAIGASTGTGNMRINNKSGDTFNDLTYTGTGSRGPITIGTTSTWRDVAFNDTGGAAHTISAASATFQFRDWTEASGLTSVVGNGSNGTIKISGNVVMRSGADHTNMPSVILNASSGTQTITSNGATMSSGWESQASGATVQLQDNFTSTNLCKLTNGTLDIQSFTMQCTTFSSNNSNTRTLFGTSNTGIIQATSTGATAIDFGTVTGLTVAANTATFKFSDTSATSKTFAGGGKNYNGAKLSCATAAGTGACIITGANTLDLDIDLGSTLTLPASTTTTCATAAGCVVSRGTSGTHSIINSSTGGTKATLSFATATACILAGYTDITDSTASGGAMFRSQGTLSSTSGWAGGASCGGSGFYDAP